MTGGYPQPDKTLFIVKALEKGGADLLELGIPYSDPIADGPTIQAASQKALAAGVTVKSILGLVGELRRESTIPVILMTYLNPLLAYGEQAFFSDAVAAGVDGLLVSDLPVDERPHFWELAHESGLKCITLVAPTTPPARLPRILSRASGFVYCLTRTGVTGHGRGFADNLDRQVGLVRDHTDLPIVCGFGVRSAMDIRSIKADVDGVVLGARLLEILMESEDLTDGTAKLTRFLQELSPALGR
ncbi:MAG: tryptophan synthase subunit alpha [Candidatus Eisenbacteria bacterium]|uniref:Tryptophan synthase alpha chain n=1 Tax=Eiseniibacteriota bacterium TaxID=2212470 RepID=A0A948W8R2_UNCEI|nr:tryptophan synthase subunit alpha [Candidatus Eisenbacteria bacterium]MBU1949324.1 tryptophan synthase subunit alpha [Candidatus Eisenbacteria bacterium]MBU2692951.1 tryptophan synthase subunit alpha [Candidatus Eisenbacteria bacterium]